MPDSGLEPELVHAARHAIKDNRRTPISHDRVWQLAGVLFCGCCGRRFTKHTTNYQNAAGEKTYRHYMRCPEGVRSNHTCPNRKHLRVEGIEETAWEFVTFLVMHPGKLEQELDREIEHLRRRSRLGDPEEERGRLLRDLAGLGRQRETLQREAMELVSEGLLDRDLLRRKLSELDEREKEMEKELAAARATGERIEDLEALKGELFLRYMHEGPEMLYHWTPEQGSHSTAGSDSRPRPTRTATCPPPGCSGRRRLVCRWNQQPDISRADEEDAYHIRDSRILRGMFSGRRPGVVTQSGFPEADDGAWARSAT